MKSSKKIMLITAVTLLIAAALFVGAGAAENPVTVQDNASLKGGSYTPSGASYSYCIPGGTLILRSDASSLNAAPAECDAGTIYKSQDNSIYQSLIRGPVGTTYKSLGSTVARCENHITNGPLGITDKAKDRLTETVTIKKKDSKKQHKKEAAKAKRIRW